MSVFVLSDLHLSINETTNKSMEVFGSRWQDYIEKIKKNWNAVVDEDDTVIIPGDISWATKLEEARDDLAFLNSLNGKKLLGKGNHDFWWATATKLYKFFEENKFDTFSILYNNAYKIEDKIICGTRGWFPEENKQMTINETDYEKIVNREAMRLRMSLDAAKKLQKEHEEEHGEILKILVFLHFPPVWNELEMRELTDVLKEYSVEECFFGHIHGTYSCPMSFVKENIKYTLTSSDFLSFYPLKI